MEENIMENVKQPRTIHVKGTGTATATPDYVTLSLNLEAKHKDYLSAMT